MNNILVLDVENSVTKKEYLTSDKVTTITQMLPFTPTNRLVSIGLGSDPQNPEKTEYFCFYHKERTPDVCAFEAVQEALNKAELLIGHNIKHDLHWLRACGFTYDGKLYDTQIAEYVLSRAVKRSLSLRELSIKRNLPRKKSDLTKDFLEDGVGFEAMPWDVVEEYGRGDITTTMHLYLDQQKRLSDPDNEVLVPTINMMCEFLRTVQEMEYNGLKIDFDALGDIEKDYINELGELDKRLHELASAVMGDTPIRLTSNDFLSELLYSRKVKDKNEWKKVFNIGKDRFGNDLPKPRMSKSKFNSTVRALTEVVRRTSVQHCDACEGKGHYYKYKKDGHRYKKPTKCPECSGEGFIYNSTGQVGGFKLIPKGVSYTSASGFKAGKDTIDSLLEDASGDAQEFLLKMRRYNAVSSYLASFVDGIKKYTEEDGILHPSLNQTVTATGRLSSSNPNFQNQPRGDTFPVRKALVSRFKGGKILEFDFAQLEFRIAGYLSQCPKVREFIDNGEDAHKFSMGIINEFDSNLPQIERQEAKPHTFKPLYGGMSGTPREKHYYNMFLEIFDGVAAWHDELKKEALMRKRVALPSGREYSFPYAKRTATGYVKESTKIVNYPVQGFATGDVVPLACIAVHRLFKEHVLKSILILTVHDSVVADVCPGEEKIVEQLMSSGMLSISELCKEFYGIEFEYPLEVEGKIGDNWLETEKVGVYTRG